MKRIALFATALIACGISSKAQTRDMRQKAREWVRQMTLEEKAQMVVGMGMKIPGMPQLGGPTVGQTEEKVPGAAGTTYSIPRLGIPTTVTADGPAGLRISPFRNNDSTKSYYATAWPIETLIASSWNTELAAAIGKAMGSEAKAYGVDYILAPALNIHRNPLGGRNFEYFSEDPVVSGKFAAAIVNGIESNGVGTSIKHYAANNQETNRNQVNTILSERALREIYLRGFEIAVKESQPWTVMSSYNRINGPYTSENYDLLTTILRKEWGFNGFVMTDWFGGSDVVAQMKAGNDLIMPGTPDQVKNILEAVKNKQLDEKVLDENVARILAVAQMGLAFNNIAPTNQPDLKAHAMLARQAAAEGIVLLKNEKEALPLKAVKKVAAFGNTSYDFISGGTGSGDVNEAYTISLVAGMEQAGYTFDQNLASKYASHIAMEKTKQPKRKFFFELLPPLAEMELNPAELEQLASSADLALITIGRNSGEFQDRKKENDFDLTAAEQQLLTNVSKAFRAKGKKVIVVLNIGGVIETASWVSNADAIVLAWQGGQEAGNALADVLTGKVNPSGKLTMSFPSKYEDVPSAKSFPGRELDAPPAKGPMGIPMGKASEVVYEEGIYVGYRYYNSFKVPVAYPFGFGLSYTSFVYSDLKVSSPDKNGAVKVSVTIANTGKAVGKESVQIYVSAPAGGLEKPSEELKAFGKTKDLKPGEKQTLHFELPAKFLASFDTNSTSWIAAAGKYEVKAAAAATDVKLTSSFELSKDITVEKCNKVLVPAAGINELKR
jgi:beta-glucosidase